MCWRCKYYLLFNVTWHCPDLAVQMSGRVVGSSLVLTQCDTHTQTLVVTGPADYHTPILDWCAVRLHRSGFCALLHAETAPFYFPPLGRALLECRTESLFSVHGGQPLSLLSDHTMQSPFALDTQQEALAMWQFPPSQVFRDCDDDSDDDCHASVHG